MIMLVAVMPAARCIMAQCQPGAITASPADREVSLRSLIHKRCHRRSVARSGRRAIPSLLGGLALQLDVILQAHLADHVELGLDEVDMSFLGAKHFGEEVAADVVLERLAF